MDEIIEKVGNFGAFQALIFAATCCAQTSAVMGMMFMMFGNYNPGWTCLNETSEGDSNITRLNESALRSDVTSESDDVCVSWRECPYVVYDSESFTVVTEWNLICDNAWIPPMVIIVEMAGVLFGSWVNGPLGDRFGRRCSLYAAIAFHSISHLISAFSTSWQMFTVMMFCVGTAVGGILTSSFIYVMEFVGSWWRPVLSSVPIWSIGLVEFSFIAYALKNWIHIHFAVAILSAVLFLPVFWMPESMRWLAVHGKEEKIERIFQRMAWWNRKPAVDTEVIQKTAKDILKSQKELAKPNYLDLFKTPKLRRYSIKFGLTWIMMACVYYMISFGIKSFSGNFYANLILFALTEVPGQLCVGPLANKIGRRYSALLFFAVSALLSFGVVVFDFIPGSTAATISLVSAIVSKASLVAAWTTTFIISTELYPTVVRNLHSGYLNAISRVGTVFSSYLIPSDSGNLYVAYTITGVLLLVSAGLVCSVSESKGRRMADTIEEMTRKRNHQDDLEKRNNSDELLDG